MDKQQIDELLDLLSRIATAVETLALAANPQFRPDFSRAKARRAEAQRGTKVGE